MVLTLQNICNRLLTLRSFFVQTKQGITFILNKGNYLTEDDSLIFTVFYSVFFSLLSEEKFDVNLIQALKKSVLVSNREGLRTKTRDKKLEIPITVTKLIRSGSGALRAGSLTNSSFLSSLTSISGA